VTILAEDIFGRGMGDIETPCGNHVFVCVKWELNKWVIKPMVNVWS
jgi:hypothetical protein